MKKISFFELLKLVQDGEAPNRISFTNVIYQYNPLYGYIAYDRYSLLTNIVSNMFLTEGDLIAKKLIYILEEELLTDEERQYLSDIIEPYRDSIKYITKYYGPCTSEFIEIQLDTRTIITPFFKAGSMYRKLMPHRNYSLEELGI